MYLQLNSVVVEINVVARVIVLVILISGHIELHCLQTVSQCWSQAQWQLGKVMYRRVSAVTMH